jgi:serine/threonine protein kinase
VKRGEPATAKSDMYSLGVTLFRMLTGIWYEPGTGAMNLLEPFDPAWAEILGALLAEDPAMRSMPLRRRCRRLRRARWVLAAALALAVLAVTAALVFMRGEASDAGGVRKPEYLFFLPK